MQFTKRYFQQENIEAITYQHIADFFSTDKEESVYLEFKSGLYTNIKDLDEVVLKSICGFLNAEGGLLIVGAPKGVKKEDKKTLSYSGEIEACTHIIKKDPIISKIRDKIVPSPIEIQFHKIETLDSKYLYLFEVGKSATKPHQINNDKFYIRLDGQTIAAPYYLTEALFKSRSFPLLSGKLEFDFPAQITAPQNLILSIYPEIANLSAFTNEENPFFKIQVDKGRFIGHTSGVFKFTLNSVERRGSEILFFGHPYQGHIRYGLENAFQAGKEEIVQFVFSFAGRNSPPLISTYKIRLKSDGSKNPTGEVLEVKENIYLGAWDI